MISEIQPGQDFKGQVTTAMSKVKSFSKFLSIILLVKFVKPVILPPSADVRHFFHPGELLHHIVI